MDVQSRPPVDRCPDARRLGPAVECHRERRQWRRWRWRSQPHLSRRWTRPATEASAALARSRRARPWSRRRCRRRSSRRRCWRCSRACGRSASRPASSRRRGCMTCGRSRALRRARLPAAAGGGGEGGGDGCDEHAPAGGGARGAAPGVADHRGDEGFEDRDRHHRAVRRRLDALQAMGLLRWRIGTDLDGEERRTELELRPAPELSAEELAGRGRAASSAGRPATAPR